jgi:hypothetical protein
MVGYMLLAVVMGREAWEIWWPTYVAGIAADTEEIFSHMDKQNEEKKRNLFK